jgi:hypothetical protein
LSALECSRRVVRVDLDSDFDDGSNEVEVSRKFRERFLEIDYSTQLDATSFALRSSGRSMPGH